MLAHHLVLQWILSSRVSLTGIQIINLERKVKVEVLERVARERNFHTWICLGNKGEQYNPDAETKAALQLAGLGEKRFPLLLDFEADEIHDELIAQFPKLEKGGGTSFCDWLLEE